MISPTEFAEKMKEIAKFATFEGDIEVCHGRADNLLCEVLTSLGYADGVKIFKDMHKWYA